MLQNAAMLTVHHLNDSRSQRILWLLEELSLPYRIKHYQRDAKTLLAPAELRNVHPLGKSPVLTDGKTTMAETGAIIEYVLERHGAGRLRPQAGTDEQLRYRYWMHFAEGSFMPPLLLTLVFDKVVQAPMPFFVRPVARAIANKVLDATARPNLKNQLDFMETELARSLWFAGDELTGADIMMSFPLEAASQRAGLDSSHPRLMAFLDRVHARPAYRRALERGGPYGLLT